MSWRRDFSWVLETRLVVGFWVFGYDNFFFFFSFTCSSAASVVNLDPSLILSLGSCYIPNLGPLYISN